MGNIIRAAIVADPITYFAEYDRTNVHRLGPYAVVAAVVSVLYIFRYRKTRRPFPGIPMAPNCHWLVRHIQGLTGDFRSTQRRLFASAANQFGQTGCWLGPQRAVVVTSLDDVRKVLLRSIWECSSEHETSEL